MKVLHFVPQLSADSPNALAVDLAFALQAFGETSVVAAPNRELLTPIISGKFKFVRFNKGHLPGLWGKVMRLRSIIRSQRVDIVQAYGYEAIAIATRACSSLPNEQRPKLVGSLSTYPQQLDFIDHTHLLSCDAISIIHTDLRSFLKNIQPSLIKSWIIPHGVNELQYYPGYVPSTDEFSQLRTVHPQLEGRFVICLPAPIGEPWCTRDIIPILSILQSQDIPAHALLVGTTRFAEPGYLKSLRREIRAAGLDQHITRVDPPKDLRGLLCAADAVLCLTAKPITYSASALQALALGRPTVGYGHGAVQDYLEAMQPMGILPVGDPDSAADMLSQWYTVPPDPPEEIPYPYKLSDTAKKYHELHTNLTQTP